MILSLMMCDGQRKKNQEKKFKYLNKCTCCVPLFGMCAVLPYKLNGAKHAFIKMYDFIAFVFMNKK